MSKIKEGEAKAPEPGKVDTYGGGAVEGNIKVLRGSASNRTEVSLKFQWTVTKWDADQVNKSAFILS